MIKVWNPVKEFSITQGFGANANDSYKRDKLIGHPGIDFVSHFGDTILAVEDGYIYKIINKDDPDLSKFRAVFQLIPLGNGIFGEICYGHADKIYVNRGPVGCGDPLISEGNTGEVYSRGVMVTTKEKENGSKAGTHCHSQIRLCKKVDYFDQKFVYLSDQAGIDIPYQDNYDGKFYQIIDYYNGFNGCVPFEFNGQWAGNYPIYLKIIRILTDFLKGR